MYKPLHFRDYENDALLDTGAIQSATSESELRRIHIAHSSALPQEMPATENKLQTAIGNIVPIGKQFQLRFFLAGKNFEETFIVLSYMSNILIGMSFYKKHSVTLLLKNILVHLSDLSPQLKPRNGKFKCGNFEQK